MINTITLARAASKIRNITLTADQKRERFIEILTEENDGKAPTQEFVDQLTFGDDGALSAPANRLRAKFNQK